jgi:PAS domain-containing protein
LKGARAGVAGLAALGVILTIAVVVQSSLADREDRLEDAGARATGMARAVEQHVAGLIDSNGQYLLDLRTQVEAEGGIDAIAPDRLGFLLHAPRLHDQATRRAFLVDSDGMKRAIASDIDERTLTIAGREYFARHLQDADRGIAVGAPFQAEADGGWVLPLSVRLDHRDGSFGGVAVLSFDVRYLLRYFRSLGLQPGDSVALVASDGRLFVREPAFEAVAGRHVAERAHTFRGVEGVMDAVSPVDGRQRIVAYHRIADYPLYAAVTVSRGDILEEWMASSLLRVALGGAVIGVIGLFTLVLLARIESDQRAWMGLARFQRAVDHAGDLLYWIDAGGRILYLNDRAARRFVPEGSRARSAITVYDIAAHSPVTWARFWNDLRREGVARVRAEHMTHDGQTYPVDVTASYLEADGADYAFLVGREPARS